jgi:hypothetical protein
MTRIKSLCGVLAITASLAMQIHAQSFLTNGLVAYYPFNGNANDASGNGNNGTNHDAITTTSKFGLPNGAFYFNGSNAYIDFGSPSLLAFRSNFTVAAWCSFHGGGINPRILSYGADSGYELLTVGAGTSRRLELECGYGTYVGTTAYYPQDVWLIFDSLKS